MIVSVEKVSGIHSHEVGMRIAARKQDIVPVSTDAETEAAHRVPVTGRSLQLASVTLKITQIFRVLVVHQQGTHGIKSPQIGQDVYPAFSLQPNPSSAT